MMPLVNLAVVFFKIGAFSFGGGYVMLPIIFQNIQQFGIMTAGEFSRLVALSQVTPGPIAINAATYVGFEYAGLSGALAATAAVMLPSFVLVMLVMRFLESFKGSMGLEAVLAGVRPATVGLLASAVVFLAETSVFQEGIFTRAALENLSAYIHYPLLALCGLIIFLNLKLNISPVKLTFLAALAGAGLVALGL